MGYYVTVQSADATIPADKLEEAFTRLKALNHDPKAHKGGGSYGANGKTEAWFSWMSANYDETAKSAEDIFQELGFYTETQADGSLSITGYDSKTGDEEQFLDAVGDLFYTEDEVGPYVHWMGEDGTQWVWTPSGRKPVTITW